MHVLRACPPTRTQATAAASPASARAPTNARADDAADSAWPRALMRHAQRLRMLSSDTRLPLFSRVHGRSCCPTQASCFRLMRLPPRASTICEVSACVLAHPFCMHARRVRAQLGKSARMQLDVDLAKPRVQLHLLGGHRGAREWAPEERRAPVRPDARACFRSASCRMSLMGAAAQPG
eukprot:4191397-Pleurochrysis_carterae.AAC.1